MSQESAYKLWKLDQAYRWTADTMQCRRCKRHQQVTWREWDFPHASHCKNATAEPRPWLLFCEAVVSARATPRGQEAA